jgi:hypothetical protein
LPRHQVFATITVVLAPKPFASGARFVDECICWNAKFVQQFLPLCRGHDDAKNPNIVSEIFRIFKTSWQPAVGLAPSLASKWHSARSSRIFDFSSHDSDLAAK